MKNKRSKKRRGRLQRKPTLSTLHLLLYIFEIILLAGVLVIIIKDIYGRQFPKPVIESLNGEVKKLPADVEKSLINASPSETFRVPILMYHYVEYVKDKKDAFRQSLNIEPHVFEEQVRTLRAARYTFMTARELGDVMDGRMVLPRDPILLTFDDGHWDLHTDILPILKKYHAKATAYIAPGLLDGSDFLSRIQLKKVIESGLVDIGAHTMHHLSLPELSAGGIKYEVSQSKSVLQKTYRIHVTSFAYPNGAFDLQTVDAVKKSGFVLALSTIPGIYQSQSNRFFLYRLRPGRRVGEELLNWLREDSFQAFF